MLKTKDGYAKVIGTSYQGSSDYFLLSNGGQKAIKDLFTAFNNDGNNVSATIGGVTKKFEVQYSNHSYYSRFIKGDDQRNADNAPSHYMTTFGDSSLCTEFSQQGKQFGNGTFVNLITSTPWRDSGGGRPAQLAIGNYIGVRSAIDDSTWGSWRTVPTIDPNGVMEIGKFIDWHWNNEIYGSQDFSTRLQAQNTSSNPNTIYLPTQSGELALLDQVELNQYHVVDMRNYDAGYWHPVTVELPKRGYNKIKVSVELNIGDKPSWATHTGGFTCNMEIWAEAHGWGTTNAETICLNYTYSQCNSNPCGWKQLGYPSLGVLFLRGGARYRVWTDFNASFLPHDKTYTWTSESGGYTQSTGGPYTSCPGLDFVKNKIYANLDGTAVNADKLDGYHASYSSNTPWGTIPVITTQGFMDIGKHLEFHYNNTTGSDYSTLLICTGNYSNIVNLPSESGTLALLSQVVSTSDFNWTNLPGKVVGGNEFNIVNSGYNNNLWFNYLPIDDRNKSATITQYNMGNGNKQLASVYAYRFKADGQSCMWRDARNYAPFYSTFNGGFEPILDIKTVSGDWSIGSYDIAGNSLVFSFTSDSDFNAGVNGTAWYYLTGGGEFKINTLRLAGAVSENMGVNSTNPQIIFAEGSTTQQVALTYTDWDTYRPSKGLKVHSHDGSDDSNVWFEVQGYNYSSGYVKNGSSDAYVLLGGGGHKPLSQFQLGEGSYLPYNGWWANGNGQDVNNSNGMIFAYASHKNSPFSSAWGIITTFDYTYNSDYKFQLAANGYSNAMYYRSRSTDRGGWTSWAQVIDTENISSQRVSYATSAGYVSNSLNIFGVSYNGSAAKTVTTSTFVSQLPEGTSTVTDGTMFITSYASDSGFADTNAVNVPYKRKASCLWSYIDGKVSSKYLPLAGGTMNGNARIGHGSGNLYIGNSGNDGWIYTQDIASQSGTDKWWIRESGAAHFGNVYICTKSDYSTYDSSIIECYNDALYLNYYSSTKVILCKGGGSVGIGTVPSYKLDVKGQAQAEGFRHSNHNSDDAVLLAGGGYSVGCIIKYWAIYSIYLRPTTVNFSKMGGNHSFISTMSFEKTGSAILEIKYPSGFSESSTMIFGNGDHQGYYYDAPVYITISKNYGNNDKLRITLANDTSLDEGEAYLYFLCMG